MDELARLIREKSGEGYAQIRRAVVLYSGGLDSRVTAGILQEWGVEIYPLILDMGAGETRTAELEKEARAFFGRAHAACIVPGILSAARRGVQTNCLAHGFLNAGGFSRPFMAQAAVRYAQETGVGTVVHGHSGLGDDHLRFELSMRAIAPQLRAIAPVRDWDLRRDQSVAYAKRQGWKMPGPSARFSLDENVWGRSAWQGELMDPQAPLPEEIGEWGWGEDGGGKKTKRAGPKERAELEILFSKGVAERVQARRGAKKESAAGDAIVPYLNRLGASFGIGGRDLVVDKLMGPKTREFHQGPAAEILVAAHADLESICLTKKELEMKYAMDRCWNKLVDEGGWFTRLRHQLDAYVDETQNGVDGTVTLSLEPGRLSLIGRSSPNALYDARLGRSDSQGLLAQSSSRAYARLLDLQETLAYRSGME